MVSFDIRRYYRTSRTPYPRFCFCVLEWKALSRVTYRLLADKLLEDLRRQSRRLQHFSSLDREEEREREGARSPSERGRFFKFKSVTGARSSSRKPSRPARRDRLKATHVHYSNGLDNDSSRRRWTEGGVDSSVTCVRKSRPNSRKTTRAGNTEESERKRAKEARESTTPTSGRRVWSDEVGSIRSVSVALIRPDKRPDNGSYAPYSARIARIGPPRNVPREKSIPPRARHLRRILFCHKL